MRTLLVREYKWRTSHVEDGTDLAVLQGSFGEVSVLEAITQSPCEVAAEVKHRPGPPRAHRGLSCANVPNEILQATRVGMRNL